MQSDQPKSATPILADAQLARLQHLLHQSLRTFDKKRSTWILDLVAKVDYEQGLTDQCVCNETIRSALWRLGANWKRAKHWITSPDPQYALKKLAKSPDPSVKGASRLSFGLRR